MAWALERLGRYIRPRVTGTSPANVTISIPPRSQAVGAVQALPPPVNLTAVASLGGIGPPFQGAQRGWMAIAQTNMILATTAVAGMTPPPTRELCYDGKSIRIYRRDRVYSSDTMRLYRWPVLKLLMRGLLPKSGEALAVMIGLQDSSRDSWYELLIDEDFVSEESEEEEDRT